jgi:hypothetical protein
MIDPVLVVNFNSNRLPMLKKCCILLLPLIGMWRYHNISAMCLCLAGCLRVALKQSNVFLVSRGIFLAVVPCNGKFEKDQIANVLLSLREECGTK